MCIFIFKFKKNSNTAFFKKGCFRFRHKLNGKFSKFISILENYFGYYSAYKQN